MKEAPRESIYEGVFRRRKSFLLALGIFLLFSMTYTITLGVASISMADVYRVLGKNFLGLEQVEISSFVEGVVMRLRLPRVLLAVIAGMALGGTGVVMQSLLRNPLASPYTLGISSGAAFGAGFVIVLGRALLGEEIAYYASYTTVIGALLMGVVTIFLINQIASLKGGGASTLILAGVAISYLFSAGTSFLRYMADHDQLHYITIWLMGGLYRANWVDIAILSPVIIIGFLLLMRLAWDINTLNAGEEVAANLGISVKKLRRRGSIIAAILASFIIAFTGVIGFIGLVAPHICRMVIGNDNRYLIPAAGITGALFLLWADTAARIIIDPSELPVGIITSLFGAPFFLYMLLKKRRSYWL